jgi:hypothetical protein
MSKYGNERGIGNGLKIKAMILVVAFVVIFATQGYCWDGYDYETGDYIDIETRDNTEIEFYDYNDGAYHTGEIQDWGYYYGTKTNDLEVYDYDTEEIRYFDME